jgi:hypothetical protein
MGDDFDHARDAEILRRDVLGRYGVNHDLEPLVVIRAGDIAAAVADGDVEQLARLHCALTRAKRDLADSAREVENRLAEIMPYRLELPDLPVLERHKGTTRKQWDSEALFDKLVATGSLTDLKACLPLTGSLSWRTGGLQAAGFDPDEWCETSQGAPRVQIHEAAA